jgi:hypothetical protein
MLYVVVSPRGALLSWNQDIDALVVPANGAVVHRPAWDAPPPWPYVWSTDALDWIVPVPVDPRPAPISPALMATRFTDAETVALEMALESADAPTRAALRLAEKHLTRGPLVTLDDPRTIDAVTTRLHVLVAVGVLAARDTQARRAAVLGLTEPPAPLP